MSCKSSKSRFLIIYASETGQAKAISEEIADKALEYGLKPDLHCISLTDKRFSIEKETCVVIVASTTGDGDSPRTARKFFRRLNRNTLKSDHLKNLNYTLLALGDSNYLKFAAFGRQLDHRLQALSATSFYPTGYGDDAFGIETGVDPWIDNLWAPLHKQLGLDFTPKNINQNCDTENNLKNLTQTILKMSEDNSHPQGEVSSKTLSAALQNFKLEDLRIPKPPSPLYSISYDEHYNSMVTFPPSERCLVSSASSIVKASLIAAKRLTSGQDVKDTLELTLKFQEEVLDYDPGDSFGFICPNDSEEVDILLNRLDLMQLADVPANLTVHNESTSKKKLPSHIPPLFSLRTLFLHCLEIRAVPKKILLRVLADYTEKEEEKMSLYFLSSQEGSAYFTDFIRKPSLTVLDILLLYKSCKPPVEKLIEYLPALKPRFYSVASSPLVDKSQFKIVFNVLKIKNENGRQRNCEGVCTGWLNRLSSEFLSSPMQSMTDKLSDLNISEIEPKTVFIYKRTNQNFKFPADLKVPVIMVGPGTGVAPFIGYLQHREKLLQTLPEHVDAGETWLFYGCRYKENDFLYREELERLAQNKTLCHLVVSFSRDTSTSDSHLRYVYESIKVNAKEITECIKSGGKILVCGDAKHMAHDVQEAFVSALQTALGLKETEAKAMIETLQKEHRYVNDVWA